MRLYQSKNCPFRRAATRSGAPSSGCAGAPGGCPEREVDQSRQRRLRQAARAAGFFGDGVETRDGVVVDRIEQQEILALGNEVFPEIVFQQDVEHRRLRGLGLVRGGGDERREPVLEYQPVGHQR